MLEGRLEKELKTIKKTENLLKQCPFYVSEWYDYLYASDTTASSRYVMIGKLMSFLKFINKDIMKVTPEDFTYDIINRYFISVRTKENKNGEVVETSGSYRQSVYSMLNNFFKFMKLKRYVKENYIESIPYPKNKDLDKINMKKKFLNEDAFKKILDVAKNEKSDGLRERNVCILFLFMTTGMRKSALMSINVDDVDLANRKITVIDKGDKVFEYPLKDLSVQYILDWLEVRKKYANRGNKDSKALFISTRGGRIEKDAVDNIVKKYSFEAIGKELTPHKLRSGFASINYKNNPDIVFVQRAMGHSNISTTMRYVVTENKEREVAADYMSNIFS